MDRRPKRQCVSRKGALPSAAHYVGYVEDQETPEMIMRKFEELDKVMAAANQQKRAKPGPSSSRAAAGPLDSDKENTGGGAASGSGASQPNGPDATNCEQLLTDQQPSQKAVPSSSSAPHHPDAGPSSASEQPLDESLLLQVFKQTSIFNVRSALANNAVLHTAGGSAKDDPRGVHLQLLEETTEALSGDDDPATEEGQDLEYLRGFWSDEEMFEPGKERSKAKGGKKNAARGRRGGSLPPRDREPSMWKVLGIAARERNIRHQVVMQYNRDTHALIRRKVRMQSSRDDIIQVRVPGPPLPTSWGRTVKPFDPSAPPIRLTLPCAPMLLLPPPPPPPPAAPDLASPGTRLHQLNMLSGLTAAQPMDLAAALGLATVQQEHLNQPPTQHGGLNQPSTQHGGLGLASMQHSTLDVTSVQHEQQPGHPEHAAMQGAGPAGPSGISIQQQAGSTGAVPMPATSPLQLAQGWEPSTAAAVQGTSGVAGDVQTGPGPQLPRRWEEDKVDASQGPPTTLLQGITHTGGLGSHLHLPPGWEQGSGAIPGQPTVPDSSTHSSGPGLHLPPGWVPGDAIGGLSSFLDSLGGAGPLGAWPLAPPPPPLPATHTTPHAQLSGMPLALCPPPPLPPAPPATAQVAPGATMAANQGTSSAEVAAGAGRHQQQQQQVAQGSRAVSYFEVPDLATCDLMRQLGPKRTFNVVLINSGWEAPGCENDDVKLVSRLRKLPVPSLCPGGFIFIWSHKTHIQATCKQLYAWGYTYVENLTWVWMHASNTVLRTPGRYLSRSHLTLIMFRKEGEGRDIQLRHQRSPDVIFDCLRNNQATRDPPAELYSIIETMLPEEVAAGRCLELWARPDVHRPGWVHAVQQQQQ